jgi:hypothetical protein
MKFKFNPGIDDFLYILCGFTHPEPQPGPTFSAPAPAKCFALHWLKAPEHCDCENGLLVARQFHTASYLGITDFSWEKLC